MFEKLTDVFTAAAVKYLTAVDANPHKSHQHEIGGLIKAGIGALLGVPRDAYFGDCDRLFRDNPITSVSRL